MHITRAKAKDISRTLHEARVDAAHQCPAPFLDEKTGKSYRLEPKPHGRVAVLQKHGHTVVTAEDQPWDTNAAGVPHVRVPLGTHGGDHLAYDAAAGKIVCTLCHQPPKE